MLALFLVKEFCQDFLQKNVSWCQFFLTHRWWLWQEGSRDADLCVFQTVMASCTSLHFVTKGHPCLSCFVCHFPSLSLILKRETVFTCVCAETTLK